MAIGKRLAVMKAAAIGKSAQMHTYPAATTADWDNAMIGCGIAGRPPSLLLPPSFVELYSITNGVNYKYFRVLPLNETYWHEPNMLVIQIWGNGDVDCIELGGEAAPIKFCGHDPEWTFTVKPTFDEWFEAVFDEVMEHEIVASPYDCRRLSLKRLYTPPKNIEEVPFQ